VDDPRQRFAIRLTLLFGLIGAPGCVGEVLGAGDRLPGDPSDGGGDALDPEDAGVSEDTGDGDGGPGLRDAGFPPDAGPDDEGDAGAAPDAGAHPGEVGDFLERDGLVAFEAEHYHEQTDTERHRVRWYTFAVGAPDPEVDCVTNVVCSGSTRPDCNEYPSCDGDDLDPADAVGGAYVEPLPDRRRTDHEPGTAGIGVVNTPGQAATLHYRVWFETTGRFYVWARARGQGPAANGLHIGLDGEWPRNDLIDGSTMRMQFPGGGWRWNQRRRGRNQHTGVRGTDEVSERDANIWLQIDEPGLHVISLGMREDGLELDKLVMTTDPDYEPEGDGPPERFVED
jgi:hypothetical protein